ncbi:MAG: histidinol dehydrogenase, partial [Pseudomonadota bacterium]
MARTFNAADAAFPEQFEAFLAEPRGAVEDVAETVREVIAAVRELGGSAVADYTAKFDELVLDPTLLQSDNVDIHRLAHACADDLKEAIDFAAARIAAYHEKQRPADHQFTDEA